MKFKIYTCCQTLDLMKDARLAGFEYVWTPTEVVKVKRQPKGQAPYYEEVRYAVMPGYIFIPSNVERSFRNWCPTKHGLRPMPVFKAPAGVPKHIHMTMVGIAEVDLKDLQDHDAAIKAIYAVIEKNTVAKEEHYWNIGDQVQFLFPGGTGVIQGEIFEFRSYKQRAKVRTPMGTIVVEVSKLQRASV